MLIRTYLHSYVNNKSIIFTFIAIVHSRREMTELPVQSYFIIKRKISKCKTKKQSISNDSIRGEVKQKIKAHLFTLYLNRIAVRVNFSNSE